MYSFQKLLKSARHIPINAKFLFRMSSEKKLKIDSGTIGTHSGVFHCDEVLACFMLKTLPEYKNSKVVRTRDQVFHLFEEIAGKLTEILFSRKFWINVKLWWMSEASTIQRKSDTTIIRRPFRRVFQAFVQI